MDAQVNGEVWVPLDEASSLLVVDLAREIGHSMVGVVWFWGSGWPPEETARPGGALLLLSGVSGANAWPVAHSPSRSSPDRQIVSLVSHAWRADIDGFLASRAVDLLTRGAHLVKRRHYIPGVDIWHCSACDHNVAPVGAPALPTSCFSCGALFSGRR